MRRVVLALALVTACHGDEVAPPDAADIGCTTTTARTQAVDAFVGPTGLQTRLGQLIDSAHTTLDVQMYLFTVTALAQKIVAAQQRGVAVRLILDPGEAGNNAVTPMFTSGGVPWKNAAAIYTYSHAKYMLIDHATAVIMSMNFNTDAMVNERNYGVVDVDAEDIADLQSIFEQDWGLANGQTPPAADLACTRLIVSPVNSQQRLNEFIGGAQTTLDVEVLYITDTNIRNAVAAAKARGVTVRVILESPQDQAQNMDTATFFNNLGIPVKFAVSQFYLHAKLLIADGKAFVGSENMSPTSLKNNREVGAIAFEPDAVGVIQTQFDADWAATTPAF